MGGDEMADELDIPMPSMMPASSATWRNVRRRESVDSSTQRLVLFAGVIGGGLLLLVGAWSLTGHRSTGVPVVEADSRPLRSKPDNPGGMQLTGQDDAILSGSSGGLDATAPPPEAPAPEALRQEAERAEAAARPVPGAAPVLSESVSPESAPAEPVSLAAPAPNPPPAPVSAVPEHPDAPAAATLAAHPSGPLVQLAALVSEDAARSEWQRLLHRMPDLLGGRSPSISRIDRSDGKVFWRLRTSGFPDIAQATAFCEKVRAKGAGCSLGGF